MNKAIYLVAPNKQNTHASSNGSDIVDALELRNKNDNNNNKKRLQKACKTTIDNCLAVLMHTFPQRIPDNSKALVLRTHHKCPRPSLILKSVVFLCLHKNFANGV